MRNENMHYKKREREPLALIITDYYRRAGERDNDIESEKESEELKIEKDRKR